MIAKYVVHPVSTEQKQALGCKVIDARFAQKDSEIFSADGNSLNKKPKARSKKAR